MNYPKGLMTDEIERLRHLYTTQYNPDPEDRNYIWHPLNPVSVYYRQAQERAIADLFHRNDLPMTKLQVLDIGCGTGGLLRYLASLGIAPDQLYGIDLIDDRITIARKLAPTGMTLLAGNADTLPYPDEAFDLVAQFTVFSSILDAQLRKGIASEMTRVLKTNGHILWYDLYNVQSANLHSMPVKEIHQLFPGLAIKYQKAMHPKRASRIAARALFLATLLECLPGFPKTHYMILLQKP
jgi:ubiquinone/menaquinone biosynthesis C-methylase UbiE